VRFRATEIDGVIEIDTEPMRDERGFLARIYRRHEFAAAGIDFTST
jgi:dTDP-4-dehydrorhamnose 3,5-epimerase-like enzyme